MKSLILPNTFIEANCRKYNMLFKQKNQKKIEQIDFVLPKVAE